jgi:hypothetical protein
MTKASLRGAIVAADRCEASAHPHDQSEPPGVETIPRQEASHDERYDFRNDLGHGGFLSSGPYCVDLGIRAQQACNLFVHSDLRLDSPKGNIA